MRGKPRRFRPMSAPASMRWRGRMKRSRVPRASAERSRCPRRSSVLLDPCTSAGEADHGRDQEQHYGDEEDDLGDFDRGAGDAAKTQNARDQRDNQKRNDPAQHGDNLCFHLPARLLTSRLVAKTIRRGTERSSWFKGRNRQKKPRFAGTKSAPVRPNCGGINSCEMAVRMPIWPSFLL